MSKSEKMTAGCGCDWMSYAFEIGAVVMTPMQSNPEKMVPTIYLNVRARPPYVIQKIVVHCPDCGEPLRDRAA